MIFANKLLSIIYLAALSGLQKQIIDSSPFVAVKEKVRAMQRPSISKWIEVFSSKRNLIPGVGGLCLLTTVHMPAPLEGLPWCVPAFSCSPSLCKDTPLALGFAVSMLFSLSRPCEVYLKLFKFTLRTLRELLTLDLGTHTRRILPPLL